jgi:glycosyltransferase involved in cell wall biosynthesis
MKKVLLVAYHFPPLGGGGVFRTLKFTKYLPEFGYQPHVLTVKNTMHRTKDATLVRDIPPESKVYRTFSFEHRILRAPRLLDINLKWFYMPDENIGWLPTAVFAGANIIKKENISVIYATSPIATSLLIGCLLKRKTKKPLVIDFRDPWTDNIFIKYPTEVHKFIERKMEEAVIAQADYVTAATDSIKNSLIERYPYLKSKIATITNGFDPDDFENLKTYNKADKFRITFAGSIYGLLTAKPFLLAMKELIEENSELKEKMEALFVGNYGKETPLLVKEFGLEDNVKLVKYVPHKECLELIMNSQALLLLITTESPEGEGILTGKLFEYLASRKPIIAIAPTNGSAAKIIKSLGAGAVVSPSNVPLLKKTLAAFYEQWTKGKMFRTEGDISNYSRNFLTQQLAHIFENVLREKAYVRNDKLHLRG